MGEIEAVPCGIAVSEVLKELRRKLGTLPLLRQAKVTYGTRSWVMFFLEICRSVRIHVTRSEHCERYR